MKFRWAIQLLGRELKGQRKLLVRRAVPEYKDIVDKYISEITAEIEELKRLEGEER